MATQENHTNVIARSAATKQSAVFVPQLRFKEFDGEWEKFKLGEIATFGKGKNISKSDISEDGILECIRYGELYTEYNEVISEVKSKTNLPISSLILSEENDVLIPASGETQIDIATASCVKKAGVALGGDLNIIKTKKNGVYLSYYLNSEKKFDIARLAQENSVVHIYNSQLKTLILNLPSLPEQQKIAQFLTAVDSKLQQLNQKKELLVQYKKGVMQQLFSQQLRFKKDDGSDYPDWERIELGDILDYEQPTKYIVDSTEYNQEYKIPVLTAGKSFILGYTNEVTGIFEQNLPVIIFDDFTTAFKYVDFCFKVKSSAVKILKIVSKDINIKFVFEAMNLIKFPLAEHKRYWISEYQYMKIPYPSKEEQQKIANYLSAIDSKIDTVTQQIEATQQFKKGLLQQLFV